MELRYYMHGLPYTSKYNISSINTTSTRINYLSVNFYKLTYSGPPLPVFSLSVISVVSYGPEAADSPDVSSKGQG